MQHAHYYLVQWGDQIRGPQKACSARAAALALLGMVGKTMTYKDCGTRRPALTQRNREQLYGAEGWQSFLTSAGGK